MDAAARPLHASAQETFVAQVRAHGRMLVGVIHAYAWTPHEREDLRQEILAQLWRAFPSYDPARRFSTWMYRVALNVAISFARGRREHVPLEDAPSLAGEEPREDSDALRTLRALVSELSPLDRALVLLYLEERSQKEIAEILGLTETAVSTRVHRVKVRLRERMLSMTREEDP